MSKYVRIGDVCQVFDGPHATPTKTETGPIYLGIDAISDDGRLIPEEYNHLSETDYKIWTKRVTPKPDDIVFSYEATLGRYAMIPEGFYGCLGRRLAIVRVKDKHINPRWLYYYFLSPEWKAFIANHTVKGSTVNRISVEDFPGYSVPFPEIEKQNAVVEVLSAIDQKIDNNTQLSQELGSMAKTLYDYWFVQFDFPDTNGKPYRASGGKMVWNEQLKREIPEGWDVGTINSLMTIDNTSVDPRKMGNTIMEHYSIPSYDEGGLPAFEGANTIESGKYAVFPDCILTSKLNPHFKRLWDPFCDTENAICSTEFIVYRPRKASTRPYCYAVLNSDEFYRHMVSNAIASTGSRKRIQPDVSAAFSLPIASDEMIERFDAIFAPMMERQKALKKENRELAELRDWLLPMLMNGQATVMDEPPAEQVLSFPQKQPQQFTVKQAARSYSLNEEHKDDTADLLRFYMERKK